jgi:hypothetical protein
MKYERMKQIVQEIESLQKRLDWLRGIAQKIMD